MKEARFLTPEWIARREALEKSAGQASLEKYTALELERKQERRLKYETEQGGLLLERAHE